MMTSLLAIEICIVAILVLNVMGLSVTFLAKRVSLPIVADVFTLTVAAGGSTVLAVIGLIFSAIEKGLLDGPYGAVLMLLAIAISIAFLYIWVSRLSGSGERNISENG